MANGFDRGVYRIDITAGDGSGVILSHANPEGEDVYITRALLVIDTVSTGACTLDIGVAANDTSNDTLFDGISVATAAVKDNHNDTDNGTNGLLGKLWTSTTYVTVAEASGDVTGFVGRLLLEYIRVAA